MTQCVIADDEPLAREGLASYVKEIVFFALAATCEDALELNNLLNEQQIDLVFLDIQMPKISGIDFLKPIPLPLIIIPTAAYPAHALEGYQLRILDYLLKPITFDRFLKAAYKAKDYFDLITKAAQVNSFSADYFFVKCNGRLEKIFLAMCFTSKRSKLCLHTYSTGQTSHTFES